MNLIQALAIAIRVLETEIEDDSLPMAYWDDLRKASDVLSKLYDLTAR